MKKGTRFWIAGVVLSVLLCMTVFHYGVKRIEYISEELPKTYDYHYAMITDAGDSDFWDKVYESAKETGLKNSVLALGAVYWITYAKLSRSLVLSIRDSEYIRAAKICGAGPTAIIFKYILPNMVSPLIVTAALDVSSFILSMAGLSFLGLGPSRPTAEWGATMSEAKTFIQQAPWCIVFPGLALLVTVVIFNLLGDALRDVIDEG